MCSIDIRPYRPSDRDRLLEIWERSVEASHDFLKAEDFQTIKSLVRDLDFAEFEVYCALQKGQITGFLGLLDKKVEMLFIEPQHFRKGIGRALMRLAVGTLEADSVDVNEQNAVAVDFYESLGFETYERSELDDQGHPYPILRMKLAAKRDPNIDAYIAKVRPFAQPVLEHLRELVHKATPDVTETTKWGMPFFDYKGPYCHMAAFKEHAVFGFWKYKLLKDPNGHLEPIKAEGGSSMGNFGKITSLQSLPADDVILDFLRQAMQINDKGLTVPVDKKAKKPVAPPDYFDEALTAKPKAREVFDAFPPSAQRDYITWLTDAKTEATREKRLRTAIEWISEGKRRNWKYEKK